ncbi:MAG: hypothetical protein ACT4OP_12055 [Actinomycetota bacterium]
MALAYCTACQTSHRSGRHSTPFELSTRKGGRHLAPKAGRHTTVTHPPRTTFPTAEDLGTRTAEVLRRSAGSSRSIVAYFIQSCRVWGTEAKRGLREIVDLRNLAGEPLPRYMPDRAARPKIRKPVPAHPSIPTSAGGVAVLEAPERDPLLEVTFLESLGFYGPESTVVVSMAPTQSVVSHPRPSKSQIPDIDLTGWKPHVIARSKLGKGRLSMFTIIGLSISLLVLAAVVVSVVRGPSQSVERQRESVIELGVDLATALRRLDSVLLEPSGEMAEATGLLIDVNTVARDLYDAAAVLPDDLETTVLRQAATSSAEAAMALESLIGDTLNYRVVLNPLWQSPELRGITDPTQAASAIATWQTHLADVTAALPATPELAGHVSLVIEFASAVENWRLRFLDDLAASDLTRAEARVADLEGQLAALAQAGEDSLATIFSHAESERIRLIADLTSMAR